MYSNKTRKECLLLYMYQKGFTEEDMYDENTNEKVNESFNFRILMTGKKLSSASTYFSKSMNEAASNLSKQLKGIGVNLIVVDEMHEHSLSNDKLDALLYATTIKKAPDYINGRRK